MMKKNQKNEITVRSGNCSVSYISKCFAALCLAAVLLWIMPGVCLAKVGVAEKKPEIVSVTAGDFYSSGKQFIICRKDL